MAPSRPPTHYPTIQALRGIAALGVCWYHMTYGMPGFLDPGPLRQSGKYGWLGVQVFFVISGFLIPFTLTRGKYQLRSFGLFLKKRLMRLHPPYLCTLAVILSYRHLERVFPVPRSRPIPVAWGQLFAHIGFLNPILGYPWFIAVFWTLAVELQFYLAIGLSFPLIADPRIWIGTAACAALPPLAFVSTDQNYLLHHLPIFGCGLFAYRQLCLNRSLLETVLGIGWCAYCSYHTNGVHATWVAVITAALILFVRISNRWLDHLGDISYSLYLMHVPIGGAIVFEGLRSYRWVPKEYLLVLGIAGSFASAYLLYRWVELPSKRWAAGLRYQPATAPVASGPEEPVAASAVMASAGSRRE